MGNFIGVDVYPATQYQQDQKLPHRNVETLGSCLRDPIIDTQVQGLILAKR